MFLLLCILAYLCGHILTAHIVGKVFYKKDIFHEGSGNPGARNAGRAFGKIGFLLVLIGDMLKAFLICLIADSLKMSFFQLSVVFLFVIVGHMFPIIYRFKGGKGVASFWGGILYLSPITTLCLVISFLVLFIFTRSFTRSGLISIGLTPIILYIIHQNIGASLIIVLIVLLMIFKHKEKRVKLGDRYELHD